MTRQEYNSVAISIDPLRDDLALPIRYSTFLQDITLLAADSIRSTQDVKTAEDANFARPYTSPLMVPEIPTGVIANYLG